MQVADGEATPEGRASCGATGHFHGSRTLGRVNKGKWARGFFTLRLICGRGGGNTGGGGELRCDGALPRVAHLRKSIQREVGKRVRSCGARRVYYRVKRGLTRGGRGGGLYCVIVYIKESGLRVTPRVCSGRARRVYYTTSLELTRHAGGRGGGRTGGGAVMGRDGALPRVAHLMKKGKRVNPTS